MLWVAVCLFFAALLLIVLEIFLPSAGVLTIAAIASMIASVVMFFKVDQMWGFASVIAAVVATPITILLTVKYWHRSWIGKLISPETPHFDGGEAIPDRQALAELVGRQGQALTPLRPVGTCEINGRRVECMAEWGIIPTGTAIEVTSVESTQVKVRPVSGA